MTQQHTAPFFDALEQAGYRLTRPRRAVAELIDRRKGHFSAADLVADAERQRMGIGRATVFRALDVLVELGVVERIDLPSGEHAYVACEPVHHHHVVCSGCGRTSEIDDRLLRSVVDDAAARTGWTIESHRLELFGRCPDCRRAEASS
jgi:Fur family transcriptional regulator, ferric uptake regulator